MERTLFLIKPYVEPEINLRIYDIRDLGLRRRGIEFRSAYSVDSPNLTLEQWLKFYEPIIPRAPPGLREAMCEDFAFQTNRIAGEILEQTNDSEPGLIEALRCVVGNFKSPSPDSIRGILGEHNKDGKPWRTLVHASTPEDVKGELKFLAELGIIPGELAA